MEIKEGGGGETVYKDFKLSFINLPKKVSREESNFEKITLIEIKNREKVLKFTNENDYMLA